MTTGCSKGYNITEAVSNELAGACLTTVRGWLTQWSQKKHRAKKWHLRRKQRSGKCVENATPIRT